MAEQLNLSALSQQINRFSSEASNHLNTFRQSAGEQNRSITKMVKDIAGHFGKQNGSLDNISSSISENADSINSLSRKMDNNTGVINQSVGLQNSMLGELQNLNNTLAQLVRITRQTSNSQGGGGGDSGNGNNNSAGYWDKISKMFPKAASRVITGAKIGGAALGIGGLGLAATGGYNQLKGAAQTPLVSNTTAAKDLPEGASALLDTIAGRESSGSYNVLNGGETFDLTKGHPERKGANGESTAAGRYQFTAGTWKETAKKAGLDPQDFSPENQDKAAWHLAKQDYKKGTKRNLEEDIKDPKLTSQVLDNLGSWKNKSPGVAAAPFSEKTFQQNMEKEKARKQNTQPTDNKQQTDMAAKVASGPTGETPQKPPVAAATAKADEGEGQGPNATATSKPEATEKQGDDKVDSKEAQAFLQSRQIGGGDFVGVNADKLNSDFAIRLTKAIKFAEKAAGEKIGITEGYRPPEVQAQYYSNYIGKDVKWQGETYHQKKQGGLAAPPGQSKHQKGMAVDISGGRAREILRQNASKFGIHDLGGADKPHFEMSGGGDEAQAASSGRRERPTDRDEFSGMGGMRMGMGIPMMGMNPMMMRGGMGGLGMGMMNPGMGMMAGGMARTGGLIGLGANILSGIFSKPSEQERPTASARLVAPPAPQPTREIERAAVQDKVEDNSKKNQPPVVIQQGGNQQQAPQHPINDPSKRNKVTSADNPWAEELKIYYKKSFA